ncbi:hypothetical protein Btru_051180 [Bulinus truncatus]|nr:hypothetical protein Btru_051180 [Bulinus truncatus]
MWAVPLVIITVWFDIGLGHSRPDLIIRIVNSNGETLDTHVPLLMERMLYRSLCRAEGNHALLRLNPVDGTADVMDEMQGMTNETDRVTSCLFEDSDRHVSCVDSPHYCQLNNECVVEIKSSCSPTNMKTMHYIDVTMATEEKHLQIMGCLAFCEDESFLGGAAGEDPSSSGGDGRGITSLTLGLIVAGVILVASVLVVGAVVWKIRDSRLMRDQHKDKLHHIEYVK